MLSMSFRIWIPCVIGRECFVNVFFHATPLDSSHSAVVPSRQAASIKIFNLSFDVSKGGTDGD